MIEYPSIDHPSKAPRQPCIAFEKLDGSNIRVKFTQKHGFDLFGSRTQLIDATHPHLGEVIAIFNRDFKPILEPYLKREFPNQREIIVFGEFFGDRSFAGWHDPEDKTKRFVMFDVLLGHKQREFLKPREFVKRFSIMVPTPKVVYEGNLNDQFIQDVREGKIITGEGVVCKGLQTSGAHRGKMWMCKIKTNEYKKRLEEKFKGEWTKYWE